MPPAGLAPAFTKVPRRLLLIQLRKTFRCKSSLWPYRMVPSSSEAEVIGRNMQFTLISREAEMIGKDKGREVELDKCRQ